MGDVIQASAEVHGFCPCFREGIAFLLRKLHFLPLQQPAGSEESCVLICFRVLNVALNQTSDPAGVLFQARVPEQLSFKLIFHTEFFCLMDAVRNYFPNRKEDLPPPLLSCGCFYNNINCLQKAYSFLTSKQLLVSAFQHGRKMSLSDFTGPGKRLPMTIHSEGPDPSRWEPSWCSWRLRMLSALGVDPEPLGLWCCCASDFSGISNFSCSLFPQSSHP